MRNTSEESVHEYRLQCGGIFSIYIYNLEKTSFNLFLSLTLSLTLSYFYFNQ